MGRWLQIVLLGSTAAGIFAADVRDLGVPAGWKASDYDTVGYHFLNKHDYENARRYFEAAIRTDPYFWTAYYNRHDFRSAEKMADGITGFEHHYSSEAELFQGEYDAGAGE